MERRELIFMDAKSSKFWNIELDGQTHTVTYGRTGTNGQSKTKEFASEEKAKSDFDKLVASKIAKGYVDQTGEAGTSENTDSDQLPAAAFGSISKLDDFYGNVKTFAGKKVADYDPEKKPVKGGKTIYRFLSSWEEDNLVPNLEHFCASDAALEATGIVIGHWGGEDSQGTPDAAIELLIKNRERLSNLNAIFLGDITSEENEMSWIQQTNLSPLLHAFPKLQLFRSRGGEGLQLKRLKHDSLRALAIETGGLDVDVIRSICSADLPNLEYLELWLGTENYGGTCSVQDLQPILSGKLFPKLNHLGFRNCDFVDDIAAVIVNSPILERVETLDLSLGILSDQGGRALLALPEDGRLKKVNLHFNYMSSDVVKQLKGLNLTIDTSQGDADTSEDEEWRYVAVGE